MTYLHCQLFSSFFVLLQFPHWLFGFSAASALLIAVGFISYITKSILIISTMGNSRLEKLSQAFTSLEKRKLYRVETKRLGFALNGVLINGSLVFVILWEILGVPLNLHKVYRSLKSSEENSAVHTGQSIQGEILSLGLWSSAKDFMILLMGLDIEAQVLGWLVGEIAGELVGRLVEGFGGEIIGEFVGGLENWVENL
jgi:hypothetical protein